MRLRLANLAILSGLCVPLSAQTTCTGLCQQQVSCPSGQTTSISGTVYAPNGTDPLPNVTVYIPNAAVDAFTDGVSCPVPGTIPSGSPLVGASTGVDGTFTLNNVPVGSNIPLVIVAGKWRRQVVVPSTAACTSTSFSTRMPQNQSEGDIPKIAVATGSLDEVECVLRKVGIADSEFTNPTGTGRINLYTGNGSTTSGGARIDANSPTEALLTGDLATLKQYDVLMLPCQGSPYTKNSTQLANFIAYANAGGRVYASHYSYAWMYTNPPFNGVANWAVNQTPLPDGTATIDTTFSDGSTLAQWLQLVGASTTQGQIAINQVKHDLNGVIAPTQSWLTLNDATHGNPVQQFTFNAPIGAANQCGRVLFNEYHVEIPTSSPLNKPFPTECSSGAMTPQEKLLEYSLFDLSNDGGAPTMTPTSADFGSQPVGFTSPVKSFIWKNNSIFSVTVTSAAASGDFAVTSKACGSVSSGSTCQIDVVFSPTALGARTGTLTVQSSANTLTAALTGTGTPPITSSTTSLNFGSVDVGATASQSVTITNIASGAVPIPGFTASGDYSATTNCGTTLAAGSSCAVTVTFKPTTTGTRTGTLTVASGDPATFGFPVQLTGNGVDFTFSINPTSGNVIAGLSTQTTATTSPVAGFVAPITVTCQTTAPASTCLTSLTTFIPTSTVTVTVAIGTTSQYTVVGYGGLGGTGLLSLIAVGSGLLLWVRRRRAHAFAWRNLAALLLAAAGIASLSGCSGKYPDKNASYTAPGTYTYTLSATDGTITHSATYSLTVTAK